MWQRTKAAMSVCSPWKSGKGWGVCTKASATASGWDFISSVSSRELEPCFLWGVSRALGFGASEESLMNHLPFLFFFKSAQKIRL